MNGGHPDFLCAIFLRKDLSWQFMRTELVVKRILKSVCFRESHTI